MDMTQGELVLFWTTVALYLSGAGVFVYGLFAGSERPFGSGVAIVVLGSVLHGAALGLRWRLTGHMPGDNIYELNSIGAWLAVLIYVGVQHYYPNMRALGVVVLGIGVLVMLYGISKPHKMGPLSGEYQSGWFYAHIISAFLAYGCYVIATSASVFILAGRHATAINWFAAKLPSPGFLEDLSYRMISYGFAAHAVMLASGSIWANTAWGSYWNWDPVETWSLVTWLIYAFYLHARAFLGWRGARLAWVTILALIAIIYTFWGVPHLPSREYSHV